MNHKSHKAQCKVKCKTEEYLWYSKPCKISQRSCLTVGDIFTLRGMNDNRPGLSVCFPPKSSSCSPRPFSYFYSPPPHLLAFYGHLALGEILISRLYSRPASDLFFPPSSYILRCALPFLLALTFPDTFYYSP